MLLQDLNINVVSKLVSHQVYYATCLECCKFYKSPDTASCGHTLCHVCWSGRQTCPVCAQSVNKKTLKLNTRIKSLAEHVQALSDVFEKLFGVKLAEMEFELEKENDPIENVKEWLASSQNRFSAPITSSQESTDAAAPKPVELSASKIQIHSSSASKPPEKDILLGNKKPLLKTIHSLTSQEDWDKIEVLPDTQEVVHQYKEKKTHYACIDENLYTTENPRRSSRKRENNNDVEEKCGDSGDKSSSKKTIQNWNNVKKMRKEFSKLNKKERNKLNVSIEMCKKAQRIKQDKTLDPIETPNKSISNEVLYEIEDQTPNEAPLNNQMTVKNNKNEPQRKFLTDISFDLDINNAKQENKQIDTNCTKAPDNKGLTNLSFDLDVNNAELGNDQMDTNNTKAPCKSSNEKRHTVVNSVKISRTKADNVTTINVATNKTVFQKKSNLCPNIAVSDHIKITQHELNTSSSTLNTDDLQIYIKKGNTMTKILIKEKPSNVQLKVTTDREIQTSLGPYTLTHKEVACSPIKSSTKKYATQKTVESTKKNTASADTTSAHFEITESVEKELSNLMECEESAQKVTKQKKLTTSLSKPVIEQPNATPLETIPEENPRSSQAKDTVISQTKNNQSEHSVLKNPIKDLSQTTALEINKTKLQPLKPTDAIESKPPVVTSVDEDINDIDMFGSGSVKETFIQPLKNTESTLSEVFMPTVKTGKTQNVVKRNRENDGSEPGKKKSKLTIEADNDILDDKNSQEKDAISESENMNYDVIMSQVFANIDADIKSQKKTSCKENNNNSVMKNIDKVGNIEKYQHARSKNQSKEDQKYSENVFSYLEKESEPVEAIKENQIAGPETQANIQKLLTPGMLRDLDSAKMDVDISDVEMQGTPMTAVTDDDDDRSVVEETPQKDLSFTNLKQKTEASNKNANVKPAAAAPKKVLAEKNTQVLQENDSQIIKSIISVSDQTLPDSSKIDVTLNNNNGKQSLKLETPVTINKFVNHIQHKSTPVARKSLKFDASQVTDIEKTLCPSLTQDRPSQPVTLCPTTQEKEFLAEAFKETPSPEKVPIKQKTSGIEKMERKKFCVAGSCLSAAELGNLKNLCAIHGWTFVNKYTSDITHLVVGVDEENKSQRSVKFMCALAASKWIVSYAWVENCLKEGFPVDEEPFEALDATGDPGPKLSRTSPRKLFEGFFFYCMPPFSILDVHYLKYMVEAAGGKVAESVRDVAVRGNAPALLLAEPERTQEDKFIYLAMEHSIVPVNYEWVLNSLGGYCLGSLYDLLLCPPTLLTPTVNSWPPELFTRDNKDEEEEE